MTVFRILFVKERNLNYPFGCKDTSISRPKIEFPEANKFTHLSFIVSVFLMVQFECGTVLITK